MRYLVDYVEVELRTRRVDARSAKEARWSVARMQAARERSTMLIVGVRTSKRRRPKGGG